MQQLEFFVAPVPRTSKAPVTKRVSDTSATGKLQTPTQKGLTLAEQLNRGIKIAFPKDANAADLF